MTGQGAKNGNVMINRDWMALGLMGLLGISPLVVAEPLRVGFGVDRPPYVMEKNRSGIEVEIVTRAAANAGMQVVVIFAPYVRGNLMLQRGQLDAVTSTQPVHPASFYSLPYIEYQDIAIALSKRKLRVQSIADLGRYSVASFQLAHEVLGPEFQSMAAANGAYREVLDEKARNLLLYTGQVDFLVGDKRIFEYFNRKLNEVARVDVSQPVTLYPLWKPVSFHMEFRLATQRDRFDQGLKALQDSGDYARILKKYE
jgi:polar amino acid transport system substrate-binding protein